MTLTALLEMENSQLSFNNSEGLMSDTNTSAGLDTTC